MDKEVKSIQEGNISLILDSYNDIFSDFDPRPLGRRAISGDFLQECRNAARDKPKKGVELRVLVPRSLRRVQDEHIIKKRLREHFRKHHHEMEEKQATIRKEGVRWIIAGLSLSMIAVALHAYLDSFWITLLFVLAEPGGWFSIWTGFDKVFLEPRHHEPEHEFYEKMDDAQILFESY
jgi:hypothetical protein